MRRRTEQAVPSRPEGLVFSAIVLVSVLVYLRTAWFDYTFDDWIIVARNPVVQTWTGLKSILASAYWPGLHQGLYRPVTILSFALERMVHGGSPGGFHFLNVILHAGVSALVYLVALLVLRARWAAALAALLFAVHPIHIEAVAGIVGRAELLSSLFALSAMLVWMRTSERPPNAPRGALALFVLFALAVCSKENVIVVPALMLLWEFTRDPGNGRRATIRELARDRRTWTLAASGAAVLALRTAVLGGMTNAFVSRPLFVENPLAYETAPVRIISAAANQVYGVILQLAPYRLLPDYSFRTLPVRTSWLDPTFLAATLLVCGAAALWFFRGAAARRLAFLCAWYIVAAAPTSNVPVAIGTVFGERLLYFPSVAFCMGIAALLEPWLRRYLPGNADTAGLFRRPVCAALLIPVVALAAAASVRLPAWSGDLALFRAAAQGAPENVKVRLWLGDALVREGDLPAAVREYEKALQIRPEYEAAAANLMVPLMKLKRYDEAIETGEKARRLLRMENIPLLLNLATSYQEMGDSIRFLEAIGRALQLDPTNSRAHYQLGRYYLQTGDRKTAADHFRESLRADPDGPEAPLMRKLAPEVR